MSVVLRNIYKCVLPIAAVSAPDASVQTAVAARVEARTAIPKPLPTQEMEELKSSFKGLASVAVSSVSQKPVGGLIVAAVKIVRSAGIGTFAVPQRRFSTSTQAADGAWTSDDTQVFLKYGACYVPERELVTDAIVDLIPKDTKGSIVDICCGGGHLTHAFLDSFEGVKVVAMDGDKEMLEKTKAKCGDKSDQLQTQPFDIHDIKWRQFNEPVRAFVSSLAIHHLDCKEKRQLFADLFKQLEPGGCLLISDILKPSSESAKLLAAKQWDEETKQRSLDEFGTMEAFEVFVKTNWNYFSDPNAENDPIDKPSTLFNQLMWMHEAGFESVDVFWSKAGHALFGGYKRKH